jgi:hypothetical protein
MLSTNTRRGSLGVVAALIVLAGCAGGDDTETTAPPITTNMPPMGGAPGVGVPPAAGGGAIAGSGSVANPGTGTAGIGTGMMMTTPPPPNMMGMAATGAAATGAMGAAGMGGMMMGTGGSTVVTPPPPPSGPGPMLPAIMGECPALTNGTIMVAGHGGISITSGPAGMGGPLLFYWHGTGGSSAEATRSIPAGVRDDIIKSGGIIASFNGRDQASGGGDCSGTGAHNINDFNAADQIAACAVKNHGIDSRRIYTTGCSAGGLQSGCMAMMRSSYIAATAPNSGGVVSPRMWQDAHSPAVFTMHGGSADVVIVAFSTTSRTFDMAAKTHGSFVVNCNHNGNHCAAPADLKTASWQFMKDHPWGFTKSPWEDAFPAGTPSYCMKF